MDTTEIKRDVRPFADPGSDVLVDGSTLIWERDGRTCEATLRQSDDGSLPEVCIGDAWMKYRDFLAGPEMADLHRFAQFVVKTASDRPEYVPTLARIGDSDDDHGDGHEQSDLDAVKVIESRSTTDLPLATRVVLVQGEAGSGKTMALRRMTLQRAEQFMDGSAKSLFFYVDVQGRSLSRLDDAMARELQDLRARFPYSAVTPLVRSGLLVPVIDGFDELLGSGGYDEAFSSLAAFVAMLEQRGAVVASARSSFFDYNNFREYATRFGWDGRLGYRVDPIHVQPWRDEQGDEYVEIAAAKTSPWKRKKVLSEFRRLRDSLDKSNRQVLSKPFYVSRITELLMEGIDLFSDTSLLDRLVEALVVREHRKLLNKDGTPLMSRDQHRLFLAELAMEMWLQESRILDFETVQELAALLAEDHGLPPDAAKAIRSRVSSYAFLTTADTGNKTLRFEHEVFYSYFLASKIGQCLEQEPDDLRRFLNRSVLDDVMTEEVARNAATNGRGCAATIESVCAAVGQGFMDVVGRENGGRLVARLIADSNGKLRPVDKLRNLVFRHDRLGPADLDHPHFVRCEFHEVEFTTTRMLSPKFEDCTLRLPVVSLGQTEFRSAHAGLGEQVQGIRVDSGNEKFPGGEYFAPGDVYGILRELGMEATSESEPTRYTPAQQRRIRLLDQFLHKMGRRFYVSENDLERFSTTHRRDWPNIRRLLEEHSLLIEQSVQKSGPSDRLLRLSHPPDIIRAGEDTRDKSRQEVSAFWRSLLDLD